jgi:hypothetical protein
MRVSFSGPLVAALVAATALSAGPVTPQHAAQFQQKLDAIIAHGNAPSAAGRRTEFSGDEVNAYLQIRLTPLFPTGVTEPSVVLVGQGRVSARAVVDLDAIRRKGSGGLFDPTSYLSGRLPVTAAGTLRTAEGMGQFDLERAEISGIAVPKSLLQEIVSYYTRSPEMPDGVNLDERFELSHEIKRIDVESGRAIVTQ